MSGTGPFGGPPDLGSGFFAGADGVGEAAVVGLAVGSAVGLAVGDDVEPGGAGLGLRLGSPLAHCSTVMV